MENPKVAVVERIKESTNVLITVSANPSVDQLAAAIGLTLLINKLGKHATAVFSGQVPSTIEFLQPEQTLEDNTDSLRDFIIALDKSKADKLRYKVEDKLVKIFITPYRTSISEKDLEFSQGDFNVDLILALGVHQKDDLDQAITAHGQILHDATIATINTQPNNNLGSIDWVDGGASSLCEMVTSLGEMVKTGLLDAQISTALLTGIVAETNRFSNSKTTSETMAISSKLLAAGANQQLVASKLDGEEPKPEPPPEPQAPTPPPPPPPEPVSPDEPQVKPLAGSEDGQADPSAGTLSVDHGDSNSPIEQIMIDEHGTLHLADDLTKAASPQPHTPQETILPPSDMLSRPMAASPPSMTGKLTANTEPEALDPSTDPLSTPSPYNTPILQHETEAAPSTALPTPAADTENTQPDKTLEQLEESVKANEQPSPIGGLNMEDKGLPMDNTASSVNNPTAPPPVPPPMMPPTFGMPSNDDNNQTGMTPGVPL
jgi:hypothetical protein